MSIVRSIKQAFGASKPELTPLNDVKLQEYKRYVLERIQSTAVGEEPFFHLYIESVFPSELYSAIESRMKYYRDNNMLQGRKQDSKAFVNLRFNLSDNSDIETRYVRGLFSDPDVKHALLSKFYVDPNSAFVAGVEIHEEEFEYVYSAAGRFQNIHTDIPSKVLSLVFYIPGRDISPEDENRNGTVFYDKNLRPNSMAKYRANSVGIFAQHFHSYHGFATTIDRPALVLFYLLPESERRSMPKSENETPPFEEFKKAIHSKLEAHPLREFGSDPKAIQKAHDECKINAPSGRVMVVAK